MLKIHMDEVSPSPRLEKKERGVASHPHGESVLNAWRESGSSETERRGFPPPPEE